MRDWWSRLSLRERWISGGGGAMAGVVLFYVLVWEPFQGDLEDLRYGVAQQRNDVAWMRQAALEIKRLSGMSANNRAPLRSQGLSLLTLIDQSAVAAGLGAAVKRVEPQGERQLRVQLESVNFDKMMIWLNDLTERYDVQIVNAVVDRQIDGGRVNARLTIQDGGS